jgi:hypothetical protein
MACLPKADLLAMANPLAEETELLKFAEHASAPEPTSPVVPFATIIDAWALEHPNPKTKASITTSEWSAWCRCRRAAFKKGTEQTDGRP